MSVRIGRDGTIIRDNHTRAPSQPAPARSSYSPPSSSYSSSHDPDTVKFYIFTLIISAVVSWAIAALISVHIFDPGSGSGINGFIKNVGPYLTFFGGIAGCFWYNIKHSCIYEFSEWVLSIVSAVVGCLIFGVGAFIIAWVVQIIFVIIVGIIAFSIFCGG